MFIIMSSISISLVDRITSFIIKKEIHFMGGSPFIMSIENMIGFGRAVSSDRFLVEIASEKVVNRCGASTSRFVKNISSENHLDAICRRVRVNRQPFISSFHNENDFSTVMNQTRRVSTVPRFSLVYQHFIAVNS